MRKSVSVLAVIASTSLFTSPSVHAVETCSAKSAALEKEISIAQQYGNTAKVTGLQEALAEVKANCTSASVQADAQKNAEKLEKKLAEKRNDVVDVQAELSEAKAKGDASKIAKYQRKLAEKKADLSGLEQELNQARAELAAL